MAQPFAVAFRTHLWSPGIAMLARRLAYYSQGADFVILADETHGELPTGHFRKLSHTDDFAKLGLPNFPADRLLWYNADYPLYLLRREFPGATHFAMVEYDVAVNTDVTAMLADAAARNIDFIADNIIEVEADWPWRFTIAKHFARPLRALVPFAIFSSRALTALERVRQSAFQTHPPVLHEDWPFAEAFIPSVLDQIKGARMEELKDHARLAHYDWRFERHVNDPDVNQQGTICHPVVGDELLVKRRLIHDSNEAIFDPRSELRRQLQFCDPAVTSPALYKHLQSPGSPELLRYYQSLAAEQNWPLPEPPTAGAKRFLVILRCGTNSLHDGWGTGVAEPLFDLVLCPYQEIPPDPNATFQNQVIPGQKWVGIQHFLESWPNWRDYDYIWLPDDDLQTDRDTINALFLLSERFNATLSAPSLSEDSFFSHPITLHNRSFFARAVTFVEVMMPCFRRDVLELALPSIAMSKTGFGWGLDAVWPGLVQFQNVIIFDHLTVRHTRDVGAGRDPELATAMLNEMHEIMAHHGIAAIHKTLGAFDARSHFRSCQRPDFLEDLLAGYAYIFARWPDLAEPFIANQQRDLPAIFVPEKDLADLPSRQGQNIALGKPALISSVWSSAAIQDPAIAAGIANNGRITGSGAFHTELESDPWWQVDLLSRHVIHRCVIFNRLDQRERCTRMSLSTSDDGADWSIQAVKLDGALFGGADGKPYAFALNPPIFARFLRITMIGHNFLHFDEVEVYGEALIE